MFNYIRSSWQKIKKKLNKSIPYLLSFVLFSSPLTASANSTLLGDGADGSITFNMLERSGTHLNRGGAITKDGYLSIDLTNQTQYGTGGGVVSVMSSSKIDVTDIHKLSLNCSIVSLPGSVSFSDLYFNFGLTTTNDGFPLNYITDTGNSAFPTLAYGLAEIKGVSFPIEFDISDIVGEYYLTFGFSCPYISSNPKCILRFYDLILYDSDGDVVSVEHILNFGNDDTSGIVEEFSNNLDSFNSVVEQFDSIENGFINDFTTSNDEIKSTLSDYQFSGNLLSCANWVTDRYMDFFDNSGDFKQYFIYPLIMGIVLFFIGRGQVILGNAYRKPYVYASSQTESVYDDSSGQLVKRTTYTRKGGKLRK